MKISVMGTGYVGLVTGACLADLGHDVICADVSQDRIELLNRGELPFWEQGLEELVEDGLSLEKLCFTTDLSLAIRTSDVLFLCVGTPAQSNGEADLTALWTVTEAVRKYSEGRKFVVIKSTVPVGTGDEIEQKLRQEEQCPYVIDVISNPEFLREGNAVHDYFNPDRIVIGCHSSEAKLVMEELYKDTLAPLFFCDRKSAEMIKYASNSFLAMKISFINMVAGLCEKVGADIDSVAKGVGADSRIGPAFFKAGIGYGGSCLRKDLSSMRCQALKAGESFPLLSATEELNQHQPKKLLEKLVKALGGSLVGKRIALFGLAFKPMTDDIRDAPSLTISALILREGASIQAYDPYVRDYPVQEITLYRDPYEAMQNCDALVIVTDWPSFRQIHWGEAAKVMRGKNIVDGRNMFPLSEMKKVYAAYGFTYDSMGRPSI